MDNQPPPRPELPLAGVRVLEFTHLIMGPIAGMILAELGADVIRVEPSPAGDPTRRLDGFMTGFSDYFNRNKRSIAIDLKHASAPEITTHLLRNCDVLVENFSPGTMDRLGYSYERVARSHPSIVYCSLKGFLQGPYDQRTALDEVVQFMGGLAYMTGPVGQPLRAGTSAVDLMGGTMAAVAILAALRERERTGRGQLIQTALFETVAFMMGQHMAASAIMGKDLPPMSAREGGWPLYQLFQSATEGERVFIAVTSDASFQRFCQAFDLDDLAVDSRVQTPPQRVDARSWLLPAVEAKIASLPATEVMRRCELHTIPFSNVGTVQGLFHDPHLAVSGILGEVRLRNGTNAMLPGLPLTLSEHKLDLRRQPPRAGEHSLEILSQIGIDPGRIAEWIDHGAIGAPRTS